MYFTINDKELDALRGISYIQQVSYLIGIRPYMDRQTLIVGVKRRISYQSLAEVLYIEPHQGITESGSPSRQQIRRAIKGLERAGLITIQSLDKQLILKCLLADITHYSQNKPDTNSTQQANTELYAKHEAGTDTHDDARCLANISEVAKPDTPLIKENNYLLHSFDSFWHHYPEKKSRERAFEVFKGLNPDEPLMEKILQALTRQVAAYTQKKAYGQWVPAWKFPANWLSQKCWEDEICTELKPEKRNEKCRTNTNKSVHDPFWSPEGEYSADVCKDKFDQSNVVNLQWYRQQ